jgi:DNA-binding transcriptional LysR family regulator
MIQAGQMVLRAAVCKQIAALEQRIGAQLLHRTTRTMHLTEIGAEFYERCARIAEQAEDAERAVASLQGSPRGQLRIAAPVTFGRRYLAPLIAPFAERHPEVSVDLVLSDAVVDVVEEGFDLAIRVAARPESALVARLLAPSRHVVCAAPDYFARRGTPQTPGDLRDHNCLVYSSLPTPRLWRFRGGKTVRVNGSFAANHGESLQRAVVDGLGVGYMPTFIVGRDVLEGRLVTALDDWVQSKQKLYVVYPRNRNLAPKVRVFVEFLSARFAPHPPWEAGLARRAPSAPDPRRAGVSALSRSHARRQRRLET